MKQRNIYIVGLALLLLTLISLGLLTSCSSSSDSIEIFIQSADAPRLTYVQGQELDLSHGVLTVAEGGEQRSLPLDNADITVTGYDPNKLGAQTLTVTYKGVTTTFEVSVVQRVTAENFETNYFIGDTFDNTKGRLRIAKDDGSTFTANLNSDKISVKSFDTTKEGSATVTVVYTAGEASYECGFDVTVHKPAKVSLTPPKQTAYASHETTLNLSGGYLTVEAAAPSTFSKYVPLSSEMVTGYDPAKVTIEHRDSPVTQVLTISYAGQSFEFPVTITYSTVYLIETVSEELRRLDWTAEEIPEYTTEQGELAADALKAYLAMSPADRSLIDKEVLMAVVRPATVYLNTIYYEATLEFSNAFEVSEGYINIIGNSYEDIEQALTALRDPQHTFNTTAEILNEVKEEFAEEILFGTMPFDTALSPHTPESLEQITPIFEYMLATFDQMKSVPDDWTLESLPNYETEITTAVSKILISNYVGVNYHDFYDVISSWRTNDDYFDIIYSYYYYVKDNGRDEILSTLWEKLPAPGIMNDWFMAYIKALGEANKMEQYGSTNGFLYDASGFMYYYAQTLEYAKQVKNSGNELYLNLFELLEAEEAMDIHLRRSTCGYIFHMGEALGMEAIEDVWSVYLTLIDVYLNEPGDTLIEMHGEKFEDMTHAMASLSPTELHSFISTTNFLYDTAAGKVLVLDCSARPYNTLMMLLGTYYREILPGDALDGMFIDLFIAMENMSLYGIKASAKEDFMAAMSKVEAAYGQLSADERTLFDQHFGTAYAKYQTICASISAQNVILPQEWHAKFNELNQLLDRFDEVYNYVLSKDTSDADRNRVTPLLFALYERSYRIYQEILAAEDIFVSSALATKTYVSNDIEYTLDRRFIGARGMFINLTISSGIEGLDGTAQMTWDVYTAAGLQSFFADTAYLLWAEYKNAVYDYEDIAFLMASFRALSADKKVSAYKLAVNLLYYGGIERYYVDLLGDAANTLITKLLETEISYSMYAYDQSDAALNDFNTKMAEVLQLYDALADKTAFDRVLGDVYNYYKDLYHA